MTLQLNWRKEALYVALVVMEVCWLYPTLSFLERALGNRLGDVSALSLLVTLVLALYVTRLVSRLQLELRHQQALVAGATVVSGFVLIRWQLYLHYPLFSLAWLVQAMLSIFDLFVLLPPELLILLVTIYLWWRAISLSQKPLNAFSVGFSFRVGILAFIWLVIIAAFVAPVSVTSLVFVYFFFGLVAVGLARMEEVSGDGRARLLRGNIYWLATLAISALAVVSVGGMMASVMSPDGLPVVFRCLGPVGMVLRAALFVVIVALAYLMQPLMNLLLRLINDLVLQWQPPQIVPVTPEPFQPAEIGEAARVWLGVSKDALSGLVLVGALLALALSLRRWRRRQPTNVDELRESVWSSSAFRRDMAALLRQGWERVGEIAGLVRRFGMGRELYSTVSIRKIYASLTHLAEAKGFPRRAAETPHEYLATLNRVLPGSRFEVEAITRAYVSVHYGEVPETPETLEEIRACWSRVCLREE